MRRHRSHTADGSTGATGHHHHHHQQQQQQLQQSARYRDDMMMEGDSLLPPGLRERLGDLFSQIEKEFEHMYAANLALQERVELLTDKLGADTASVDKPPLEAHEVADYVAKNKKPQLTQRIKTTYKQSTSKLVSSFRQPHSAFTLVRHYRGHRDGVWEVSVSRLQHAGGQVIATASADHSGRVYSIESGACLLQYLGHRGSVNSVRFHPSQDLVLSASGDGTAHIWRAQMSSQGAAGDVTVSLRLSTTIIVLVRLNILCYYYKIMIQKSSPTNIEALTDRARPRDQIMMLVNTAVFASSVDKVVSGSDDRTVKVWDMRNMRSPIAAIRTDSEVNTAVFASSVDKVVSGSDDRTVKVWDMRNMRSPIAAIRTDSEVNRLSVSPSQNVIAIPHDNRNIRLFDLNGVRIGRLPRNNRQGHSRMVCATAWADSNSACNLFSCGFDRQVLGWMINVHSK
ncbi:hypothetical protein EGW08_018340, partial [Elysia chlorotica]